MFLHDAIFPTSVDVGESSVSIQLAPAFNAGNLVTSTIQRFAGRDRTYSVSISSSEAPTGIVSASVSWADGTAQNLIPAPAAWDAAMARRDEGEIGAAIALRLVAGNGAEGFEIAWGSPEASVDQERVGVPAALEKFNPELGAFSAMFRAESGALPPIAIAIAQLRAGGVFDILSDPGVREALRRVGVDAGDLRPDSGTSAVESAISQLNSVDVSAEKPVSWYANNIGLMLELDYYGI